MYARLLVLTQITTAGDGVVSFWKDDYIELVNLETNTTNRLVSFEELRDVCSTLTFRVFLDDYTHRNTTGYSHSQIGTCLPT